MVIEPVYGQILVHLGYKSWRFHWLIFQGQKTVITGSTEHLDPVWMQTNQSLPHRMVILNQMENIGYCSCLAIVKSFRLITRVA